MFLKVSFTSQETVVIISVKKIKFKFIILVCHECFLLFPLTFDLVLNVQTLIVTQLKTLKLSWFTKTIFSKVYEK